MSDELGPEERRLADLFREVEAPASMRRYDSAAGRGGVGRSRWWARLLLAPISAGGERRLRPLAAALVLPLLVLAVGGGLQLRAHFSSRTAGSGGSPPARSDAAMAFDAANGDVVLFGGRGADGQLLGDTWTWDGSGWTQHHSATSPEPRTNAAMAFDAAHSEVVLTGGISHNNGAGLDRTWTWDGSQWHSVSTPHRPAGEQAGMAYDAARNQLVLVTVNVFPIATAAPPHAIAIRPAVPGGTLGTPNPPGVAIPPQVVDSGSMPMTPHPQLQTWAWTGSDWKLQSSVHTPTGWPNLSSLAWDAKAQRVVMLTNEAGSSTCGSQVTSVFTSISSGLSPARPASSPAPAAHGSAGWSGYTPLPPPTPQAVALQPNAPYEGPCSMHAERSVGSPTSGVHCAGCPLARQWSWDGSAWRETRLGDGVSFISEMVAADPGDGQLIAVDSNDTWSWSGSKWTRHANPNPPGLRLRHNMALAADTTHNVVVLFGGRLGGQVAGDTWTWDGHGWTHRAGAVPPKPTMFEGSAVPGGPPVSCHNMSVVVVPGPPGSTVRIELTLTPPGAKCAPATATLTLNDPGGAPLKVAGNGQAISGVGQFTVLWSNWCGARAGSVSVQRDNQDLQTAVENFPTCSDRSKPSTLVLQHPVQLFGIP